MKICNHWTAGTYNPCSLDLNAYHFLIDSTGKIYKGKYSPQDNLNCKDNKYAKHCGGGNTNCIGVSLCGMFGFDLRTKETKYPITKKQFETLCALNAFLSQNYNILINEKNVFTHYEFDKKQKIQKGKIDITYLPFLPKLNSEFVGEYIRNKTKWYKQKKLKFIKKGKWYEII